MLADRYVGWLTRHSKAVLVAAALAVAASAYLAAFHLPLRSDFSYLLPKDAPAVRDAERLAKRMPAQDVMLMLLVSEDPRQRAAAGDRAAKALAAIDPDLVARIEHSDAEARAFVGTNRHLFTSVADLETARKALADRITDAKLRANPMYIDLDDAKTEDPAFAQLRAKQQHAQARLARDAHVSADGKTQVIVIRTAFHGTDVERDLRLMEQLNGLAASLAITDPNVTLGYAGGPVVTVAEHGALTRGMMLSSLITMVLVALVLFVHLRSVKLLALLTANIIAATLVAFGVAAVTIGHLNAATAFLGAIIAGNGVNYGILLVARYVEERRRSDLRTALAVAIAATLRPTLVASLGAAVAYGALIATQFRGFADFAVIGGLGMIVCWIASFTVLPALVLRFAAAPRRDVSPLFGRLVVQVFGFKRPAMVIAVAGGVMLLSTGIAVHYLASDPYEYDLTQLRSKAPDAIEARRWLKLSDDTFGRGLAGIAGQTFIAVDRADQVPRVVDALKQLSTREPIVGPTASILDIVPRDQDKKLAVLADIRRMIDEAAPLVDDAERAELLSHRPPETLRAITPADLPAPIAAKLTERAELPGPLGWIGSPLSERLASHAGRSRRIGHVIAVRPGDSFDERDGRDLIQFAAAVRQIELDGGETVSTAGASVLFADVLVQIQQDGPLITGVAVFGLIAIVLLVVGRSRRAAAVLIATGAGSIAMIAVCALAGLKVTFLDFVALPITLGLGVDYAINVADRAGSHDPLVALRSTGGTVLVCSLTTIIGYASLLVSDNLSIRGFGLASLIGEVTCVIAALVLVPAIIALPAFATRPRSVEELTSA